MSETDLAFINRIDKQNSFMAVSPDHERLRNLAWRGVRAAEDMELVRSQNAALRAEVERLRAALWDIHAVCNNWDWFIWMWPIRRIKRIARTALEEPSDE